MARKKTSNSDRKQAEEALRENEERQRSLFENMLDGYAYCQMLFDGRGRPTDFVYLAVNSAFTKLTGLEDVVGRKATEVIPGIRAAHPELLETYGRVATTGQPERFEIEFKPLGIWFSISVYSPEKGYFTAVFDNITERKMAQEERERLLHEASVHAAQLQEANERLTAANEELRAATEELQGEIADRKKAEQAIRKQAALIDLSPDAIMVRKVDGTITFWSQGAESLYGWTRQQALGRQSHGFLKTQFPRPLPEIIDHVEKTGSWSGELTHLTEDGRQVIVQSRWQLTLDRDGHEEILESNVDITERKRAEEEIRQNQRTFAELIERAPFGIYIVDSQFRIAQMNAGSQNGAFRNVRPVIGRDFAEAMRILWPEPVAAEIIAVFRHTLETGESYYSPRFTNPRHDIATVESYEWELHRMTLPDGQYGVICYYYDSTKLRDAEEALRRSEDRFRTMANAIPQLAWIAEADGYLFWYNQRWYDYTGTTPEQMKGWGWQSVHDPQELPKVLERWKSSIATGQPFDMIFPLRGSDGVFRPFLTRVMPLKDEQGRVQQWFGTNTDISEQKRAEEALRQSEERFRVAQELSPDGFLIFRPLRDHTGAVTDFLWIYENDAAARMNDTDPKEVRGKRVSEVLPHHDQSPFGKAYKEVAQTGEVRVVEEAFYDQDTFRQPRWFRVVAVPTAGGDVAILVQNVTERKQAEEALRQSEERFRSIFTSNVAALAIWDTQGRLLDANERFLELIGSSRAQFAAGQLRWDEATPPEMRQRDYDAVKELQAGREIEPYEKEFVRPDGTRVPVIIGGSMLPGTSDIGVAFAIDVTGRRRAEEALMASRNQLQAVIDNTPAIVYAFDLQERFVMANTAVAELLHSTPEQMIGKRRHEFMPQEDADRHEANDRQALAAGRALEFEEDSRLQGRSITWLTTKFPLRDAQGRIYAVAGISADISERKRMEEALREWNATLESKVAERTAELQWRTKQLQKLTLELSQAEERERRRIAVILHEDLQQQIAGAKFHLSLVKHQARDDRLRTQVDSVDTMLTEAIEKSRSLSRDLSPAVVQMNDLAEVLQWLTHRIRAQQGLGIDLKSSGDMMLRSEALATFLFRAAQEMLFNAVKHAHVREAAMRVRRFGRYVGLSVSDQGQGFDPQELKETSGIGLFSIRERAELLGGRLRIKSAKGRGSRFSIVVPDSSQDRGQQTEDGRRAEDRAPSAVRRSPSSVLRVLLVDDHEVVRQGLAALLREAPGVELVGEAPDGRTAINLAAELRPDVVIMDVSMPLMSGEEATRQIKSFLPQTRVIALSMYDEAEKKQKMFEAGAEGYILKTISAEELLAAIHGAEPDTD